MGSVESPLALATSQEPETSGSEPTTRTARARSEGPARTSTEAHEHGT